MIAALVLGSALVLFWALLEARGGAPKGQVLAVVNGREITVQDVQAEARGQGLSYDHAAQPVLLEAVVRRVMMAQAARARQLDHSADYPSDRVRAEDEVLARLFLNRTTSIPPPSPAQVDAFVAGHPEWFAERRLYRLRQLTFSGSADLLQHLSADPTVEGVRARLAELRVTPAEQTRDVTSEQAPAAVARVLAQLSPGRMLLTREGETIAATEKVAEAPAPLTGVDAQALARRLLVSAARRVSIDQTLSQLKRGARIAYRSQPPS